MLAAVLAIGEKEKISGAEFVLAYLLGVEVECRQSNHEGVLVDWLHDARGQVHAVLINAGAYTHTSIALHDALKAADVPAVELHLSNVHKREAFRHHSYISMRADAVMAGFGTQGYTLALERVARIVHGHKA